MSLQLLHEVQYEARRLVDVHCSETTGASQARIYHRTDHRLVHVIEVPNVSLDDEEYTMTGCEQAARLLAPSTVDNRCGEIVRSLPLLACVAAFRSVACSLSGHLQKCKHAPHKHMANTQHDALAPGPKRSLRRRKCTTRRRPARRGHDGARSLVRETESTLALCSLPRGAPSLLELSYIHTCTHAQRG